MSAVTDWIQAIGTTAALAGLAYQTARQRREDQERERDRRHAEGAQARLVLPSVVDKSRTVDGLLHDANVGVINHSSEPVFDVLLAAWSPHGGPPGTLVLGTIGPGARGAVSWTLNEPAHPAELSIDNLEIRFTDSAGREWRRRGTEQPESVGGGAEGRRGRARIPLSLRFTPRWLKKEQALRRARRAVRREAE